MLWRQTADVRSHDLRRTFASIAADEGYSDAIGELLGHARRGVTARHYIRRPDAALVAAADRVSGLIAAALDSEADNVVKLRPTGRVSALSRWRHGFESRWGRQPSQ